MGTPIYDGIKSATDYARANGYAQGRHEELKVIIARIKELNPKPSIAVKKILDALDKRLARGEW